MPLPAEAPPLPLFAYGALADAGFAGRLLERSLRPEPATLVDFGLFELARFGCEVVVPAAGESVEGLLYRSLSATDFERLDAYQGVGEGLYARRPATARPAGRRAGEPAWVYVPTERTLRRSG